MGESVKKSVLTASHQKSLADTPSNSLGEVAPVVVPRYDVCFESACLRRWDCQRGPPCGGSEMAMVAAGSVNRIGPLMRWFPVRNFRKRPL